jgi:hypothetical protein
MKDDRQFESLKRYFTESELREMNAAMQGRMLELKTLKAEKTSILTTLGATIKTTERDIWDLLDKITTEYEIVDVEIVTLFDTPKAGVKRIVRVDNSEVLREEPMSAREQQRSLFEDRAE